MMPTVVQEQAPIPLPSYQRAQARLGPALHIDALTLVRTLHLLTVMMSCQAANTSSTPSLPFSRGTFKPLVLATPLPASPRSLVRSSGRLHILL